MVFTKLIKMPSWELG